MTSFPHQPREKPRSVELAFGDTIRRGEQSKRHSKLINPHCNYTTAGSLVDSSNSDTIENNMNTKMVRNDTTACIIDTRDYRRTYSLIWNGAHFTVQDYDIVCKHIRYLQNDHMHIGAADDVTNEIQKYRQKMTRCWTILQYIMESIITDANKVQTATRVVRLSM